MPPHKQPQKENETQTPDFPIEEKLQALSNKDLNDLGARYIPEVRSYVHYNKMKQFMNEADWKKIEPKILREIQKKDPEDYLRIC